jgi:hypothetical protein
MGLNRVQMGRDFFPKCFTYKVLQQIKTKECIIDTKVQQLTKTDI